MTANDNKPEARSSGINDRTKLHGEPEDGPAARAKHFRASRMDRSGKALAGTRARAVTVRRRLEKHPRNSNPRGGPADGPAGGLPGGTPGGPGSVNWTPIGPSVISGGDNESGRVMALAIGPSGTRIYAGAANGGVWLSTDGGAIWTPLDDYFTSPTDFGGVDEADSLAIGALLVRFGGSSGDEVFVGTGDPDFSYDAYFGVGIRHLVGSTWTLEATNLTDVGIYNIVIDPDDVVTTNVWAATQTGIYRRPTSGSMATWNLVSSPAFANPSGRATAMVAAGSGATKVFYAAFEGDKVYSSPNGTTWTALTGLAGSGRIALAAAESDPSVLYAFMEDGTLNRLNGTSFSSVSSMPIYNNGSSIVSGIFPGGQGWYDIAVAVDPTDPNTVYLGGDQLSVYKGTITGGPGSYTFPFNAANAANPWVDPTWIGSGVHSDVHAIAFALNAAGTAHDPTNVWVGSDGGVFQSTASGGAGTFESRNQGLAITEFSYLAQRADTDAVCFAGAQDNGTPRIFGEQASRETAGGDGGGVVYDPNSAYNVLRQYLAASLDVSTDGGASWSGVNFPPVTSAAQKSAAQGENTGFTAPLAAIANGSATLAAFGTFRLWLTSDWGSSWVTLPTGTNPYTPATPNMTQDQLDGNVVTALQFASPTRLFVATASYFDAFGTSAFSGSIYRFDESGSVWTNTQISTSSLPAEAFTALSVEDATNGSLYVTLGGGGYGHCYYYDGSSWTEALPATVVDVPTHAVVVDPANPSDVYVGTDVGCWKGVKSGSAGSWTWTWTLFSQGLPESAITDMAIHNPARLLRAATHGRAVWEIDLAATTGLDPDVYVRVNYNDTGRVNPNRKPWVEGHPDPTNVGYVLYHWMSADIKVRRSSLTGLPTLGTPVTYDDFAVNIGDYIDPTLQIETADSSGTDRIFVEVHNRSLTPVPAAEVQVLLLWADATMALPPLPSGYATHINSADTSNWLAGSSWHFVDPTSPYRIPLNDLDVRTPQVVEYDLDFSTLGLPSTDTHVCLATFVIGGTDQISTNITDLNQLTMSDKHVAHRNLHLVTVSGGGETPPPGKRQLPPRTVLLDCHNPFDEDALMDLVFDQTHFPGKVALILPTDIEFGGPSPNPLRGQQDFQVVEKNRFVEGFHHLVGDWLEKLGEFLERIGEEIAGDWDRVGMDPARHHRGLKGLDPSRIFVASSSSGKSVLQNVRMSPGAKFTLAISLQVPEGATNGDRYRLDAIQQRNGKILGGSGYYIAVTR
jgi:hypothetical protein